MKVEIGHDPELARARARIASATWDRSKTEADVAAARREYVILRGRALIRAGHELLASVDAEGGDR